MPPTSALPSAYYAIFAIYEPLLCWLGFMGAIADPKATHDTQAPWPGGIAPSASLSRATFVTIIQLGHVCALLGTLNTFVLSAARTHLAKQPALQEKIVQSLLTPLIIGDFTHLATTFWALGDDRWDWTKWESTLWIIVVTGISLMIPRICWYMGVGRYVDERDRPRESDDRHMSPPLIKEK